MDGKQGSAQPVLETPRLALRGFTHDDAPEVRRLAGEYAIADTTLAIPHPYIEGMAEAWIATHASAWMERKQAVFAVTGRESGQLLGAVGLIIQDSHERAELGYWIGAPFWNRGYATEAARAVVAFGFESLRLNRIQAHHLTRNPASGKVLLKIGMQFEGKHRQAVKKWDRFEDIAAYAILIEDWNAREGAR